MKKAEYKTDSNGYTYVGEGTYSHCIPRRDGRVILMRDGHHDGTEIYWSQTRKQYVVVGLEWGTVTFCNRIVLVRGGKINENDPLACDLDSPDGLAFYERINPHPEGEDLFEDWIEDQSAELLWDSNQDL